MIVTRFMSRIHIHKVMLNRNPAKIMELILGSEDCKDDEGVQAKLKELIMETNHRNPARELIMETQGINYRKIAEEPDRGEAAAAAVFLLGDAPAGATAVANGNIEEWRGTGRGGGPGASRRRSGKRSGPSVGVAWLDPLVAGLSRRRRS